MDDENVSGSYRKTIKFFGYMRQYFLFPTANLFEQTPPFCYLKDGNTHA